MEIIYIFFIGMLFSFLGSIPPGTINLSVMQLGVNGQMRGAWFFIIATVIIEFVYAAIAVKFQIFLTKNTLITEHFQIISGLALLTLGFINLSKNTSKREINTQKQGRKNFRKGFIISLANPLNIPFWLVVTAFLQNKHIIALSGPLNFWSYIFGITLGTFLLLWLVANLSSRLEGFFRNSLLVYKLPGLILVCLGLYSFVG